MPTKPSAAKSRLGSRGQPEESRAAILRAAVKEFAEHGTAGARTDAIAQAAGVNKALLYYYFKDKETLYGEVLDEVFGGLKQRVFGALEGEGSPRTRILAYTAAYYDYLAAHPLYPRVVQREMMRASGGESPHIQHILKEYFRPIFGRLTATIEQGIAAGEFRRVDPMQFIPTMIATIVWYFVSAPILHMMTHVNPLQPARIAARREAVLDFISMALFEPSPRAARGGGK